MLVRGYLPSRAGFIIPMCNICGESVQEMHITYALKAACKIGGILCPECRVRACECCGVVFERADMTELIEGVRICFFCTNTWPWLAEGLLSNTPYLNTPPPDIVEIVKGNGDENEG